MAMHRLSPPWLCRRCAITLAAQGRPARIPRPLACHRRGFTVVNSPSFRLAVIGAGPAGFYATKKVISELEGATVDIYEQLPVPYGLVRFGVAPDHPEVKVSAVSPAPIWHSRAEMRQNCQETFQKVACSPRVNFHGNLRIGQGPGSIPLCLLLPHYNAILFAYGASRDRKLGIPGNDQAQGVYSARAFVGWYNGLPEFSNLAPNLTSGEDAIVIGHGNVALDVARILLRDPASLRSTDITEHALETLRKSRVKRVRVVGRRGPIQAVFTIKEIRELINLSSTKFEPILDSILPSDSIIKGLPRAAGRIMNLLRNASITPTIQLPSTNLRSVSLDFCLSPRSLNIDPASAQLTSVTFEKTSLVPEPFDPKAISVGNGEMVDIKSSLAFISVGYKSEILSGFKKWGIPFNEKLGIIPNDSSGRVIMGEHAIYLPRLYCAGWVKNGPTGNIASTLVDAFTVAESITRDCRLNPSYICHGDSYAKNGWNAIKSVVEEHGCRPVSWKDWERIDMAEQANGRKIGKEREKFTSVEEMLAVLD